MSEATPDENLADFVIRKAAEIGMDPEHYLTQVNGRDTMRPEFLAVLRERAARAVGPPREGDTVTVAFTGTVDTVTDDGRFAVTCPGGSYFYVNPAFGDGEIVITKRAT